jgi:hypothetical protein
MVAGYLNVLRNADAWTIADLPKLELKPLQHPLVLPKSFPHQTSAPQFLDGELVRWLLLPNHTQTDRGIVIGRFFAFASLPASLNCFGCTKSYSGNLNARREI